VLTVTVRECRPAFPLIRNVAVIIVGFTTTTLLAAIDAS
jgi:hypothetical protein